MAEPDKGIEGFIARKLAPLRALPEGNVVSLRSAEPPLGFFTLSHFTKVQAKKNR